MAAADHDAKEIPVIPSDSGSWFEMFIAVAIVAIILMKKIKVGRICFSCPPSKHVDAYTSSKLECRLIFGVLR